MKKLFLLFFLAVFALTNVGLARVQYDSTGRKIIYDDTIRGRKQARQLEQIREYKAAAKINYQENTRKKTTATLDNLTPNYYQLRQKDSQE